MKRDFLVIVVLLFDGVLVFAALWVRVGIDKLSTQLFYKFKQLLSTQTAKGFLSHEILYHLPIFRETKRKINLKYNLKSYMMSLIVLLKS